jgi:hypothetical protein
MSKFHILQDLPYRSVQPTTIKTSHNKHDVYFGGFQFVAYITLSGDKQYAFPKEYKTVVIEKSPDGSGRLFVQYRGSEIYTFFNENRSSLIIILVDDKSKTITDRKEYSQHHFKVGERIDDDLHIKINSNYRFTAALEEIRTYTNGTFGYFLDDQVIINFVDMKIFNISNDGFVIDEEKTKQFVNIDSSEDLTSNIWFPIILLIIFIVLAFVMMKYAKGYTFKEDMWNMKNKP